MNVKTTLVLLLLVIAAALYFVFFELDRPATRQRQPQPEAEGTRLFHEQPLVAGEVTRLVVERPGQRVTLERAGEQWRQVEPITFPLADHAVTRLLTAAADLHYTQLIDPGDEGLSLDAAGLAPPRVALTIEHGERASVLRLGQSAPGGHGYLMLDEHPEIHLVNDALHALVLEQDVRDWRRRTLDTPAAAATERIEIADGDRTIELHKLDGRWYLDADRTARASAEAVEALTDALADTRIDSFTDDQPEDLSLYGLHAPRFTLTLHTPAVNGDTDEATDTHTLRLGSGTDLEGSSHFATWSSGPTPSPVVFTLRERDVDELRRDVDELRDPRLVTTPPREVNAIEIERPDRDALHLVRRRDRGFEFGTPDPGYGADDGAVTRMLEDLAELEAEAFEPAFEPEGAPILTAQLTPRGGAAVETLRAYDVDEADESDAPVYDVLREGESVAYRVRRDRLEDLFKPRLAYRDRDVLAVDADALTQVTLERADGVTFTFLRDDDDWTLAEHEAFDAQAFETLLDRLAPLRAERWVIDDESDAGEGASAAVLTLELAEASPRVLRVNPETGRASLDGIDAPFVLPRSMVDALEAEYRERVVLRVRQQEIDSVTIGRASDAVTLRRDEEGRYVADDDRPVNQAGAGRLFDTLAGLRVERYETFEPDALPGSSRRLTVRVRGEQAHELALIAPGAAEAEEDEDGPWQRVAVFDGRVVRLSERDFERLTAEVTGEPRAVGAPADEDQMVK